jgi:prepilin-type N-terminal cleavage/methylation domain-containing protein
MKRYAGFNIIELMVTVAVLGVLLGIGVPGLQALIQNNRLTSQINLLSTSLAFARSEAIKLNERVVVCVSTNGTQCAAPGSDLGWDDGWLVFVDRNGDGNVDPGAPGTDDCAVGSTTDCILNAQAPFWDDNTLTPGDGAADILVYVGDGSVRCNTDADMSTLETCDNADTYFTLCDFRGADHAKALTISRTGRVAYSEKAPDGSDLTCP